MQLLGFIIFVDETGTLKPKEECMEKKDLKKLLAGLGIVSLIGAGSVTLSGCATSGSG